MLVERLCQSTAWKPMKPAIAPDASTIAAWNPLPSSACCRARSTNAATPSKRLSPAHGSHSARCARLASTRRYGSSASSPRRAGRGSPRAVRAGASPRRSARRRGSLARGASRSRQRARGLVRRALDVGRGVGVLLVERLVLEQRLGEGVQLVAVVAAAARRPARAPRRRSGASPRRSAPASARRPRSRPGRAARPSAGATASGPIAGLMPQRATIWRTISVSCWMSDSAPVVGTRRRSPRPRDRRARP